MVLRKGLQLRLALENRRKASKACSCEPLVEVKTVVSKIVLDCSPHFIFGPMAMSSLPALYAYSFRPLFLCAFQCLALARWPCPLCRVLMPIAFAFLFLYFSNVLSLARWPCPDWRLLMSVALLSFACAFPTLKPCPDGHVQIASFS